MILQSVRHSALVINVVMISKDCETTERRFETRKDCRDRAWRYTAAAEWLHIDVVPAKQHEIRCETCSVIYDRVKAHHVIRMRPGVKIGKKGYAQGAPPLRPSDDLQLKTTNDVPLSSADVRKPSLATKFVAKRWTCDGARQSTSRALPSNFAHVL